MNLCWGGKEGVSPSRRESGRVELGQEGSVLIECHAGSFRGRQVGDQPTPMRQ